MNCDRSSTYDNGTGVCSALGCMALGAGLMYLLDPKQGARRRSVARGKMSHAVHQTGTALRKTAEYARGQAQGLLAETRTSIFGEEPVSDQQLAARVRSAMGRCVSHPRAIQVSSDDGIVTLRGQILAHEVDDLLSVAESVRGVQGIDHQLEVHKQPGDIPALQGGTARRKRYELMQYNWSPTMRLAATLLGGGLALSGLARRHPLSLIMAGFGAALAARGLTNLPAKRLVGIGAGRRAIDVQKTININAPVEIVFDFWSNYENFPCFMSNVREVRDRGDGRSHWIVAGPAGIRAAWDAEITCYEPNECIAWRSIEGSMIENAGIIRFQPNAKGGTRVDIKLSYNPPGGALGHLAAMLFGADPKSEIDADLSRVKTTLETGIPPHDAARPTEGLSEPMVR